MPKIAVTRTIHALPGKRQEMVENLERDDEVRRKWGMVDSFVLEKVIDPLIIFVMQIWQSEEHYERWRQSAERNKLLGSGRGFRVREPGLRYRVLEHERAEGARR